MSSEPIQLIVTLRRSEEEDELQAVIASQKAEIARLRGEISSLQNTQFELISCYDRIREARKLLKQHGLPFAFLDR